MLRLIRYLAGTLFTASFLGAASGLAQPVFVSLPDVAGGDFNGQALDLSPNGVWVAGWGEGTISASEWPWRWSEAAGLEELDPGQSLDVSRGTGISDDGSVVAVLPDKLWRQAGGFLTIPPPTSPLGFAFIEGVQNMNAAGTLILWDYNGVILGGPNQGSVDGYLVGDSNGNILEEYSSFLESPNGYQGNRISSDGTTIVAAFETGDLDRWGGGPPFAAPLTLLSDPNLDPVVAVSRDGAYAAGSIGAVPFVRSFPGGVTHLPPLPSASTCQSYGVSATGNVVVGTCRIGTVDSGFVWTPSGGTELALTYFQNASLDITGWSDIKVVSDVSDDGTTFTGWGDGPGTVLVGDGDQAFYARVPGSAGVPALGPVGLAILAALAGANGLHTVRRRRRA